MRTSVLLLTCLIAGAVPAQGDHVYTVTTTAGLIRRINPVLPPGLPPDVFLQIAIFDAGNLVVSNPIQLHIL